MKKIVLLLVCVAIICPATVFAAKPKKPVQVISKVIETICPAKPTKPVEVIPKIVDSNGKTVGYILLTYLNSQIGMSYNGQDFLMGTSPMYGAQPETYNLFPNYPLMFDDESCSGNAYVSYLSVIGKGWGIPSGFYNNDAVYITDIQQDSVDVIIKSEFRDGPCSSVQQPYWTNKNVPINKLLDFSSEFQPPFKLKYGYQVD